MSKRALKRLLIPTERVDVYWQPAINGRKKPAVAALWAPPHDSGEQDLRAKFARIAIRKCDDLYNLQSVQGACDIAWLKTLFPEHLFASICTSGLTGDAKADEAFFWEVVRQFARIEGCAWARRMYEQREQRELTPEDLRPWWRTPEGKWEWSPLPDRGGKLEPTDVLFANAQWIVTGDGLECDEHGYYIEVSRLTELRDGLLSWPLHMVEKAWVEPELFFEAFALACRFHGAKADEDLVARSLAFARNEAAHHKRYNELWPVAAAKLYPEKAAQNTAGKLVAWDVSEMFEIGNEVERMMMNSGKG